MRGIIFVGLTSLVLVASAAIAAPVQAGRVSIGATTFTDGSGNTVTLAANTVLLDAESLGRIRGASDRRIDFTTVDFPQADLIRPGSVIIASQSDDVQMLFAESVRGESGVLVVLGRPATLAEAFTDLRIKKSVRFDTAPRISSDSVTITSSAIITPRTETAWSYRFVGTAIEKPESGSTANAGLLLSGSFALQPQIDVDIDLRESRYEFAVEAEPSVTLSVDAATSFSVEAPMRLADIDFQRKILFVGLVPVELHPQLSLDITIKASASAGVSARIIDYSQDFRVGVGYVDGAFRNTSQLINPFDGFRRPSLSGTASAEGSITLSAELFVNLYELAGPTVRIELVGSLHVQPLEAEWAWVEADVNILLGGRISILGSEGGPEFSFDVAPNLGPWKVWSARPRDPATYRGVVGFSEPTTRIELNGVQCSEVEVQGVDPSTVKWRLPEEATSAGLRLGVSETGQPAGTELAGTRACIFASARGIRTYVEVLLGSSRTGARQAIEISSEVVNPPRLPMNMTALAQYEGAEIAWTATKSPSYWTVTATTRDRKVPETRRTIVQTAVGSARSIQMRGLVSRADYVVSVHGTNDAGTGAKASVGVRPLGRILLVGQSARVGTWSDGVALDNSPSSGAPSTFGLMLLSSGANALALVPAESLKKGAKGTALVRLRLKDGALEWYAKGSNGAPLSFRGGTSFNLSLAKRTFVANPSGTSIVLYQCIQPKTGVCDGHFVRVQPNTNRVTRLPEPFQKGFGALVSEGSGTEGDWAMSADGRYVVTGAGQQVVMWDLDRKSQVSSTWNPESCGGGRCSGSVHSVGIANGNRVIVSTTNTTTSELCLNDEDIWEWAPATDRKRLLSPTQPYWVRQGEREYCIGESSFILPVGAASAPRVALYEVDDQLRTSALLLDLPSGKIWRPHTFPIYQSIIVGAHEVADVQTKLSISADGAVMAVPVYAPIEDGAPFGGMFGDVLIGAHLCHFRAKACTLALGRTDDAVYGYAQALYFGGVQLSGSAKRIIFLSYNQSVSTSLGDMRVTDRVTWWRQDLNPKLD